MSDIVSPYRVLIPGEAPPDIIPWCARCDMPCESYCQDIVTTGADWIGVHASCCGYTSSSRIPWKSYLELKATNRKWYAIVVTGRTPGLRGRAKSNTLGWHG